jgi:ABC-2 type transport system ATP-binding protein
MLIVENLIKKFNGYTAVDNLSFKVEPGKIFGLLGPNGAGKTTTLRTVLNILKPNSGNILFDNSPITPEFYNSIGYLPEERGLYRKSKVIDVIIYFAALKAIKKQIALKLADDWLRKLNIERYREKKIEQLSKGNQQKIQFITSVIHNPKLLILDEPFTGFDPINQQEIKELILSFVTSGSVIILSTHQMDTAEKLCENILLLDRGKEVCSGSLKKIKNQFGGNNIRIRYSGNINEVSSMEEVLHIDYYSNYAELELKNEIAPNEFLKKIINKIEVSEFTVIEPTLNRIFIELIKKNSAKN